MTWPPKILLALFAALTGCSRDPSFRDVQRGKIPLKPAQQQAVEALLEQADFSPRRLSLGPHGTNALAIEDGEVVALRFSGRLTDPRPLARLPALRDLHLWSARFSSLEGLGAHPNLETLSLSQASSIESLKGLDACPALRMLAVRGPLGSLAPLSACLRLEKLYLHHPELEDLTSLPELPHLALLSLGPAEVRSLAGLEGASGLRELLLSDLRRLSSLRTFPPLPALETLRIFRGEVESLEGLPPLPALRTLHIEDTPLRSLEGLLEMPPGEPAFPRLEVLSAHDNRLAGTLRLPALPSLREADFSGNAIEALDVLSLPALESLDLSRNPLTDLSPLEDLPSLRIVRGRGTEVGEVPAAFQKRSIHLDMDEAEIEANYWERTLRESWEEEGFVERLPGGRGRIENKKATCRWSASTFRTARLSCRVTAETVQGFLHLPLVEVDPIFPTSGGPSRIPVRATLSVEHGTARVYLRDRIDFRGLAEGLAGRQDRSGPWISFGDDAEPEDVRDGFRYAEARPGQPATVTGEAKILAGQVLVWLEALGGDVRGLTLELDPP